MNSFRKALPVWYSQAENTMNQFAGFYTKLETRKGKKLKITVAARSCYRLFINGKIVMHGPARTAKGYCRTDTIPYKAESSKLRIAFEVAAYDKPEKYSNDCTLEAGMLCAEITDSEGNVLRATGDHHWACRQLHERRSDVEMMSHSRGIIEYYDLTPSFNDWHTGKEKLSQEPVILSEKINYLERRSPLPDLKHVPVRSLISVRDMKSDSEPPEPGYVMKLSRMFNEEWYRSIPQENCFQLMLRGEKEQTFTGTYQRNRISAEEECIAVKPGVHPVSLLWSLPVSELGFIDLNIHAEKDCIIDLINSDHRSLEGEVRANTYVARYCLKAGEYHLTGFEPKLVRYLRVILRTEGMVKIQTPVLIRYTHPDMHVTSFECSDGDLNRIYEGAVRTLRLNTLDIFMDCPQRERGGWLCDSNFTARAAWQVYGNADVEHDFIENFMLTDKEEMWHGFFPEVYPGSKTKKGDPGFQSWSFWLVHEVYEYYTRTGDRKSVDDWKERIGCFIEGVLSLKGESGLIEGLNNLFVDWSLSNRSFALSPISIPVNCLISKMLYEMAELYDREDWKKEADQLKSILGQLDETPDIFGGGGDAAEYRNGVLKRLDCATETGAALELYSGYHHSDQNYLKNFIYTMGYAPAYRSNPNIGKSNLFIGLMIRFAVLEQLGRSEELIRELKDLYLPELRDGSGTFFENFNALSGCHGFNGAAAAMLTNRVLGLGEPRLSSHTIEISPCPGNLRWAAGSAACDGNDFFMNWSFDIYQKALHIQLDLPDGWTPVYHFQDELRGYAITVNGEKFQ